MAPTGKLIVKVVEAKDVPAKDSGGTSDPYVKVSFAGEQKQTTVIEKTLRPKWGTTFDFMVRDDKNRKIRFEMYDKNKILRDEFIGELEVDIEGLLGGRAQSAWFQMLDRSRNRAGELLLELEFQPDARRSSDATVGGSVKWVPTGRGRLRVRLIEGRNLAIKDLNGTSDPFCVMHYAGSQQTSRIIDKNLNPVWNDEFEFPVERADRIGSLKVVMFDHDKLKADYMGEVTVDLANLLKHENFTLTHEFQLGKGPEPEYRDEEVKGSLRLGLTFLPDEIPRAPSYSPAPPAYQQAAPQYQQAAPQYQQAAPQYQQAAPQYQQAAPQYQQAAPQYQQAQPVYQQASREAPAYATQAQQGYSYDPYNQGIAAGGVTDGTLHVTVVKGRNLAAKDPNGKSDPYVIVRFKDIDKKSSVKWGTLDPDWNETISFEKVRSDELRSIRAIIMDKDKITRDDYMGEVQLDLAAMQLPQRAEALVVEERVGCGPEHRNERVSGHLTLAFRFERLGQMQFQQQAAAPAQTAARAGPVYGTLSVALLEARDVLNSRGADARAWGLFAVYEYSPPPPPPQYGQPPPPPPPAKSTGQLGRRGQAAGSTVFEDVFSFPVAERFGTLRVMMRGTYRAANGRDADEYLGEIAVDVARQPVLGQPRVEGWFELSSADPRLRATGQLFLALSFSPGQPQAAAALSGTLDVNVVAARGLRVAARSTPYVVLTIGRNTMQTRQAASGSSPAFDEHLQFPLDRSAEPLLVRVMERDQYNRDEVAGEASVSIAELLAREPRAERWIPVTAPRDRAAAGELLLRFDLQAWGTRAAPYPQGYPPPQPYQYYGTYAPAPLPPMPRGESKGTLRVELFEGRGFLQVDRDRVARTVALLARYGDFCSRTDALPVGLPGDQRLAWFQAVDFDVYSLPVDGVLHVQALESIMGGPEQTIGEAAVALSRLALDAGDRKVEQWVALFSLRKDSVIGEARVALAFSPRYPALGGPGVASRAAPQAYPPEPLLPWYSRADDRYPYPPAREPERREALLPPTLAALPAYREYLRIDPSPIVQTGGKPVAKEAKPDPTVVLDVGGTEFRVDPAIFKRYPDSLLHRLLCEAKDENKDGNGKAKAPSRHVFFDRNPRYFALLLDFCREGHVVVHRDVNLEGVKAEARYFDLYKYMFPAPLDGGKAAGALESGQPLRHPSVSSSTPGVVKFSRGYTKTVTPAQPADFYVRPNEMLQIARCKGRGMLLVNVYDADGLLRVRRGVVHDASMHVGGEATAAAVKDGVWTYPGEFRYEFFLDGYLDDTEALRRQAWIGQCAKCLAGTIDSTGRCDRCDFRTDVSHKTGAARKPRGPGVPADTMEVEFRLMYHFAEADDVMLHVAGAQPGGRADRDGAAHRDRDRERLPAEERHRSHSHHHSHGRSRSRSPRRGRSHWRDCSCSRSRSRSGSGSERERRLRERERALRRAEARLARRFARNPFFTGTADFAYPYGSSSRRRRGCHRCRSSSRSASPSSASTSSRTTSTTERAERTAAAAAVAAAAGTSEWAPYNAGARRLQDVQHLKKKKKKPRSRSRAMDEAATAARLALQWQQQQQQQLGPFAPPSSLAQPAYSALPRADAADRLAKMAGRLDASQHQQLMTIMALREQQMTRQLQQLQLLAERGRGMLAPAVIKVVRHGRKKKPRKAKRECEACSPKRGRSPPAHRHYDYGGMLEPPPQAGTQVVRPKVLDHAHTLGDLHLVDARRVPSWAPTPAQPAKKEAAPKEAAPKGPEVARGPSYYEQFEQQEAQRRAREAAGREEREAAGREATKQRAADSSPEPGALPRSKTKIVYHPEEGEQAPPPPPQRAAPPAEGRSEPALPAAEAGKAVEASGRRQWRLVLTVVEAGKLPQGKGVYRAQVHVGTGGGAAGESWEVGEVGPTERPKFNGSRSFTLQPPAELAMLSFGLFYRAASGSFQPVAEAKISLANYLLYGGDFQEQFSLQSPDLAAVLPGAYVELKINVAPVK